MASDEDYMAFLDKANQDPNEGYAKPASSTSAGGKKAFKARDEGAEVPAAIKEITGGKKELFYTSDADEPFEAVVLGWDEDGKTLPDEEEFATLIGHWDPAGADVQILDPFDWDGEGQYTDALDAVRAAGKGSDVRVYRVGRDGSRAEYWLVTCEGRGKSARLVGVKALAVES